MVKKKDLEEEVEKVEHVGEGDVEREEVNNEVKDEDIN